MRLISCLLLLAVAMPVAAQEQEIRSANLPRELEWEILRMFDGAAERYEGPATIGPSEAVRGDVAAMGGPLRIAGRVEGDVAMVNGDVVFEPGGSVAGDITVIGGEVQLAEGAVVGGTITAYATAGSGRRTVDRDRDRDGDHDWDWDWEDDDGDDWWDRRRHRDWDRGYSRLTIRTGSSYNRVEGLPVMFGPVIRTAGSNPFRLEALAIWRSESGASLDTDRMGYRLRAEQFLGGGGLVSFGASAFSVVDPLDGWQISDLEASLATAVFHDDYRDHFDRTGWSAFVRAEPIRGLEARLEYRAEDHASVAAGDPWSLFHGDDTWRLQPLVAEGDIQLVSGALELDLRDDREDPEEGWYGRVSVERPVGGDLARPALVDFGVTQHDPLTDPAPGRLLPAEEMDMDFTNGLVDLRRYTRVVGQSQLNLRVVAGGSLSERPLPSQYQHVLGGIGTLPGYSPFHADCGARTAAGGRADQRYFASYGCDRFALAQVEYRGELSLDFGFGDPDYDDDDWWDDVYIDMSPTWVVFMDAGRGWAYGGGPSEVRSTNTLVDAGLGFLIDDFGIYAALPLNGDVEQEPRFFIRLGRRF